MTDPRPPDYINLPGVLPDSPGSLWGSNNPQRPRTFAQQIPRAPLADDRPKPQVLSKLSPEPGERVVAQAPAAPERRVFEGSFAGLRAMRLLHQYRIDFWGDSSAVALLGSSSGDPSEAQLDQAYDDFVLFSYLPPQLMPTKAVFRDMSRPTARSSVLRSSLPTMGINTAGQQVLPQTRESTDDATLLPIITAPPPYSETLGSLCSRQFFNTKIQVRP